MDEPPRVVSRPVRGVRQRGYASAPGPPAASADLGGRRERCGTPARGALRTGLAPDPDQDRLAARHRTATIARDRREGRPPPARAVPAHPAPADRRPDG